MLALGIDGHDLHVLGVCVLVALDLVEELTVGIVHLCAVGRVHMLREVGLVCFISLGVGLRRIGTRGEEAGQFVLFGGLRSELPFLWAVVRCGCCGRNAQHRPHHHSDQVSKPCHLLSLRVAEYKLLAV